MLETNGPRDPSPAVLRRRRLGAGQKTSIVNVDYENFLRKRFLKRLRRMKRHFEQSRITITRSPNGDSIYRKELR